MIRISKIISTALVKGKLIIKVLRLGSKDVQNVKYSVPFGLDSNPNLNYRAIYSSTGEKGENVLLGIINDNAIAAFGETRLFSNDLKGNEIIAVHLTNDGNIKLGGDVDNAVRFSVLETAYDELKDDFNSLVDTWNTFALAYVPGSPVLQGTPPTASTGSQSSGDISGAKIDNILTP